MAKNKETDSNKTQSLEDENSNPVKTEEISIKKKLQELKQELEKVKSEKKEKKKPSKDTAKVEQKKVVAKKKPAKEAPKVEQKKVVIKKKPSKDTAKVEQKKVVAKKKPSKKPSTSKAEQKEKAAKRKAEQKEKAAKRKAREKEAKRKAREKEAKRKAREKEAKIKAEQKEKEEKIKAELKEKEERKTYEEEIEEQLSDEEIENFQIERIDMDKLINKVSEIIATYAEGGILQSDLWKKLKLSSRDGSRLALKLERMGIITREKLLEKGRWTYKLIIKKSPISTQPIEGAPCLICPVEQKCSLEGEISPRNCQLIEDWVMIQISKPKKAQQ